MDLALNALSGRPRRFDLIAFDWDGTLYDSTAAIVRSIQAAVADVGGTPPSDEEGERLLGRALDLGYNHLDTANIYTNGSSETLLGTFTAGRRDPICPPEATRRLADWFRAQGAGVEMLWHPGGHEIAQDEIAAAARFLGAQGGEDRRSA